MTYTSEIEKLEKRWAENPRGRNFAPLADAYRKAGELDRALELCKAGLDLHPDYVSAHIVLGRCLIDQKNDAAAADVFRKVLTLDPENVLGLKILAEIAERGARYDEAVDWLNRLLAADPMNGDAAELLARAKRRAAQAVFSKPTAPVPAVHAPEPVVRLVPEAAVPPRPSAPVQRGPAAARGAASPAPPAPAAPAARAAEPRAAPLPKHDVVVEQAPEGPIAPDLKVKGPPAGIETFDGTLDFNAVAHDAAKADGLEVQEDVVLTPQELNVEGLAHTQYESGMFAPPPQAAESEDELPAIDLPLIMPDDVAPLPPGPPPPAPPPPAPPPPPAAVALSDDDGAADTAALSRAEPVLTETMAELYLRQGHEEDALRVYQALVAQRPGDARLRARVNALSPGGKREQGRETGESLPSFLKRILTAHPGAGAPPPPGESSLANAFAIAAVQPDPEHESDVAARGEVTRPAADSISLDAVFGEESPHRPVPASQAAPPPGPASQVPSQTGGFSFDQFFNAPVPPEPRAPPGPPGAAGASAGGGDAVPQAPARPSGPKPRPPVEDEGELDQFQAWLRGLKS